VGSSLPLFSLSLSQYFLPILTLSCSAGEVEPGSCSRVKVSLTIVLYYFFNLSCRTREKYDVGGNVVFEDGKDRNCKNDFIHHTTYSTHAYPIEKQSYQVFFIRAKSCVYTHFNVIHGIGTIHPVLVVAK